MWTRRHVPIALLAGACWWVATAACGEATPGLEAAAKRSSADTGPASDCRADALRPSAVPPTEGVWSFQSDKGASRVAVMLGPTEVRGGSAVVTRNVEAIESGADGERRSRVDTAVVHLDLLPPYGSSAVRGGHVDARARQSAAVYAITPLVLIAAYEPCGDVGAPAIRYVRRDARGSIAVDAMLRRETEAHNK